MGIWKGSLPWLLLLTAVMFVGSICVAVVMIVRMPTDYLTREHVPQPRWLAQRPLLRGAVWILKNVAGYCILLAGFVMLVTPGQGLLFIFLGLSLVDFPGKHALLRRVLGNRRVLKTINRIRARAHRPPLDYG